MAYFLGAQLISTKAASYNMYALCYTAEKHYRGFERQNEASNTVWTNNLPAYVGYEEWLNRMLLDMKDDIYRVQVFG